MSAIDTQGAPLAPDWDEPEMPEPPHRSVIRSVNAEMKAVRRLPGTKPRAKSVAEKPRCVRQACVKDPVKTVEGVGLMCRGHYQAHERSLRFACLDRGCHEAGTIEVVNDAGTFRACPAHAAKYRPKKHRPKETP